MVFARVTIRVSDLEASRRFYELASATPDLVLEAAAEPTQRLHVAFGVVDRAAVDRWWRRLVDAGYESDGEPGERPVYTEGYYGGFVLDPDGNSLEAVHHPSSRHSGIDHLWLRSTELAASRDRFLPVEGVVLRHDTPECVTFGFDDRVGSFTFVPGDPPTRNVVLGDVAV